MKNGPRGIVSPQERWHVSEKLWEVYFYLGGSLDTQPDLKVLSSIREHRVRALLMGTIAKLSYSGSAALVTGAILLSAMNSHSATRKIFLTLASLCLLGLYVANASAQLPAKDNAAESLRSARTIYVKSSSVLVGASVVEAKLQKRAEFSQLGLAITRDPDVADLILELEHDVFTKYVYTAIDRRTNIVVASGKLSSLGGTVAGKVAKRFLKQVMKARATGP